MTVVVGVAAPDGIILAADSRTTFSDEARHRIGSDSTQKVFELCGRFAVATYGIAFIAEKTVGGLMDEFVAQLPAAEDGEERDVHEFTQLLGEFFDERLRAWFEADGAELPEGWLLGFLVGGYDSDGIGHIVEVVVPGPEDGDASITTADRGVAWRGQTDVIRRLIKGVDLDELVAGGAQLDEEMLGRLGMLEYVLLLPISMQDAVDFAAFLISTTIEMQRFSDGTAGNPGLVPGCGGPIRIVAVTQSGVDWVSEQPLMGPRRTGRAEGALD
jgi:hypothetical protein